MKRRLVWLVVSCLMVATLVLAACAPEKTEKKEVVQKKEVVGEEKEVVAEKEKVVLAEKPGLVRDALGRLVEAPQYGGIVTISAQRTRSFGTIFIRVPQAGMTIS